MTHTLSTGGMKENEYRCDMCGEINTKGWSDDDSKKEANEIWGKPLEEWKDSSAVVCDDCFQKINPLKPENAEKVLSARAQI